MNADDKADKTDGASDNAVDTTQAPVLGARVRTASRLGGTGDIRASTSSLRARKAGVEGVVGDVGQGRGGVPVFWVVPDSADGAPAGVMAPYLERELAVLSPPELEDGDGADGGDDSDLPRLVADNRLLSAVATFEERYPGFLHMVTDIAMLTSPDAMSDMPEFKSAGSEPSALTYDDAVEVVREYLTNMEESEPDSAGIERGVVMVILDQLQQRKSGG